MKMGFDVKIDLHVESEKELEIKMVAIADGLRKFSIAALPIRGTVPDITINVVFMPTIHQYNFDKLYPESLDDLSKEGSEAQG